MKKEIKLCSGCVDTSLGKWNFPVGVFSFGDGSILRVEVVNFAAGGFDLGQLCTIRGQGEAVAFARRNGLPLDGRVRVVREVMDKWQ